MRQVRVSRSSWIEPNAEVLLNFASWAPASPELERDFAFIVEAGNQVYGAGSHWLEERQIPAGESWPDATIWQMITQSMRAWTVGDMDGHMAYFTPDAVLVTPTGSCHRGEDDIRRAFSAEDAELPNKRMQVRACHITYPATDTAIVLMNGSIEHDRMPRAQAWASTQTVARRQGHWKIAAHHVFHLR